MCVTSITKHTRRAFQVPLFLPAGSRHEYKTGHEVYLRAVVCMDSLMVEIQEKTERV